MDKCAIKDCSAHKYHDSVRGYCKEHHLAYQEALCVRYFAIRSLP